MRYIYIFLIACVLVLGGCSGYHGNPDDSVTDNGEDDGDDGGPGPPCNCEENTPPYDPNLDPHNVYLDLCVEWAPGTTGTSRFGKDGYVDENGVPIQNNLALGPPEGAGAWSSGPKYTCVGVNGSAAWRFDEDYYVVNGPGNDFVTFCSTFAWGMRCDGLCCELARVEVSKDMDEWYYNNNESYDINPNPTEDNDDYAYFNVTGLHGNNPTWANHTTELQACEIKQDGGQYKWVPIYCVCLSRYFEPDDPYLGGVEFDLSDFRSKDDDTPWPSDGEMKYLRIIDDNTILDGQDYFKDWCLGANMMSAMALNYEAY
jgi:hypothetical protein